MNIFWHFNELKIRFIYIFVCFFCTFLVSYINIDIFIFLMIKPLNTNFIFINLFEGFYCFFTTSIFLSCFFLFFIVLYSIFDFIKPGLTKNENKVLVFIIKVEFCINLLSIFFSYQIFLPHLISFLLSFEQNKNEHLFNFFFQARLLDYILISLSIFYLIFILFQFPFFIFLCIQFQIVSFNFFVQFRREFIVLFFLIGCLLSPPDIYSQILLAFPCVLLYELIIFIFIFLENF